MYTMTTGPWGALLQNYWLYTTTRTMLLDRKYQSLPNLSALL
jgi:hypothetical protein